MPINPEFIKLIVSKGLISDQDVEELLLRRNGDAMSVLKYLLDEGVAPKHELGKLWGDSINISYVDLNETLFEHMTVQLIPEKFARKNHIIPLYQMGEVITAAIFNPLNDSILQEAQMVTGKSISLVFSFKEEIEDACDIEYRSADSLVELTTKFPLDKFIGENKIITVEQLRAIAGNEAVVNFTNDLLLMAVKEKASDIHIEPSEESVRIRFRIDGVLQVKLKLANTILQPLISRLKILANLDITEKRKPQDGRINLKLSSQSIDFRFSTVPTLFGEKIVMRILGQLQAVNVPDLSSMDFSKIHLKRVKKIVGTPNGIFFVTGPTGSGKTTTLYAALKYLNKPEINIMTIEDPVEYRLPGINQVQVNPRIDLNFAKALRAFLRQDPDVILIGEVRDMETAQIASQAALTGHLVMATMHTNNSIQAVTRLIEIGVEPFLVAPSIIGILAQRLVRRICVHCKERYKLAREEIEEIFIWDGKEDVYFSRGKGCPECNSTGYSGRIAIHELFVLRPELRALIAKEDTSSLDLQELANKHGFKPLRYDGLKKVLRGLTTIEEIDRATVAEEEL
ncbi:GspE/PulE family protein [Gemmatimonadota bacterium]